MRSAREETMPTGEGAPRNFRPLDALTHWIVVAWALLGALALFALFQVWRLHYLMGIVAARKPLAEDALARWLVPRGVVSGGLGLDGMIWSILESVWTIEVAFLVLGIPAALLVYVFLFRVHGNVVALGGTPRYARHWIVTGFLVPFLNLVRPYQVVADLWRASSGGSEDESRPPVLVRLWWECLLIVNVIAIAAGWRYAASPSESAGLVAAAAVARLVLVALLILLVRELAEIQRARHEGRAPRATVIAALPAHAGADVALLAVLGLAAWGVAGLGSSNSEGAVAAFAEERARIEEQQAEPVSLQTGVVPPPSAPRPAPLGRAPGPAEEAPEPLLTEGGIEDGVEGGVEGGLVGGIAGGVIGDSPGEAKPGSEEPLRGFRTLTRIAGDPPRYTDAARAERIQGVVILQAVVGRTGEVEQVRVLKGLPGGLDQAAVAAVRTWKFEPARMEGRTVRVYQTLTVVFRLD
jgi:protein TonB